VIVLNTHIVNYAIKNQEIRKAEERAHLAELNAQRSEAILREIEANSKIKAAIRQTRIDIESGRLTPTEQVQRGIIIIDRTAEIQEAQQKFETVFENLAGESIPVNVGYQGGSDDVTVTCYQGKWVDAEDGEKKSRVVLIGTLSSPDFCEKVRDFVFEAEKIKNLVNSD
jgi:hypothetical protein